MPGLGTGPGLRRRPRGLRITIALSARDVDDDAAPDTAIGTLSVAGPGGPWSFALADDAGGRFALVGASLRVGATALSHAAMPAPTVTVSATSGGRTVTQTLALNVRAPLPALPLAAGATTMLYGHSFVSNGGFVGSADAVNPPLVNITTRSSGEAFWLRGLDPRFNLDSFADLDAPNRGTGIGNKLNGSNQGYAGGVAAANALANVPYALARKPRLVSITYGVNDVLGGNSAASLIAVYDQLLAAFRNEGVWVVADTIAPIAASRIPDGDPRLAVLAEFNAWLRAQEAGGRSGLRVFDAAAALGGDARPDQSYWLQNAPDGLHPQERGAHRTASAKLAVLQGMVAAGSHFSRDPAAANLMPNAAMTGTAGTRGAGITGSVATNYGALIGSGDSILVAAKETSDVSGFERQVFTVTRGPTAGVHELRLQQAANTTLATLGLAAGDWLKGAIHVELSAWDQWVRAQWTLLLGQGSTTRWTTATGVPFSSSGLYLLPTGGLSLWLESEPFRIPSDVGTIDVLRTAGAACMGSIRWLGGGTGTGTVKISKPILRKVTDPRPAWML